MDIKHPRKCLFTNSMVHLKCESSEDSDSQVDRDAPPSVTRETGLDTSIRDLHYSCSSALHQYQLDAAVEISDELILEPSIERSETGEYDTASDQSQKLEDALISEQAEFAEVAVEGSVNAQLFQGHLVDAENVNRLMRAELEMPSTRLSWWIKLRRQLAKAPQFLRAMAKGLRVGSDIARVGYNRFHHFGGDGVNFLFDQFNKTTGAFNEIADIIEKAGESGAKQVESPPDPDPFDIDKVVSMILDGKAPPDRWVPLIQELNFREEEIIDVSPLSNLTALAALNLYGTQVSDVSPLSNLTALARLNLNGTQVSDVSPLSNLTALAALNLTGTQVSDVSPLSNLTALAALNLTGTQVSDVSPLSNLTALETLDLNGTQVSDVSPLSNLMALYWLNLNGTQVSDVSPLDKLRRDGLKIIR